MSSSLNPMTPLPCSAVARALPPAEAVISSRSLLGEASTLTIEHQGMHYTLRATRNGKLILTK